MDARAKVFCSAIDSRRCAHSAQCLGTHLHNHEAQSTKSCGSSFKCDTKTEHQSLDCFVGDEVNSTVCLSIATHAGTVAVFRL